MTRSVGPLLAHALAAALLLTACGGGGTATGAASPPAAADRCGAALPSSLAPEAPRPLPPLELAPSMIVTRVEVPLATVQRELEAKIPRRLAEERDHDIGVAGRLEYTVDRGAVAVGAEGETLAIETKVTARARACAKGRCYASCEPEARVVARVPLRADARYRLGPSTVTIDVTRGCRLQALGGLVRVDVTPILAQRLERERRRVEQTIDAELPDLRPLAARLWGELEQPRALPLGACAVVSPESIVQGPASSGGGSATLAFALIARPEIRLRCGQDRPPAKPLPPLRSTGSLPADGEVSLAFVLPGSTAEAALAGAALELGKARAFVATARGDASVGFLLGVRGEACGEYRAYASGAAWKDDAAITLSGVAVADADAPRLSAEGLDAAGLARGVEGASIPVPMPVGALVRTLPELVASMSDPRAALSARVASGQPDRAGLRGPDLIAVAKLRGAITIGLR